MPTSITCPNCQVQQSVPDEYLGKRLRCKQCGQTFVTQAPIEVIEPPEPPRSAKANSNEKPARLEESPRPRAAKRDLDDEEPVRSKKRPVEDDLDDEEEDLAPVRSRRDDDVEEDDEEERPRRSGKAKKSLAKTKKKRPPSMFLVLGLSLGIVLVLGSVVVLGIYLFTGGEASTADWSEVVDKGGKYRVKFPAKAVADVKQRNREFLDQNMTIYECLDGFDYYMAMAIPMPSDFAKQNSETRDKLVAKLVTSFVERLSDGSKDPERKPITYQGNTGFEIELDNKEAGTMTARQIYKGSTVYVLITASKGAAPKKGRVRAFFNSLKFD